ncbi:MAG: deoxyribonuclease IV [Candidatus Omnitrophica bacterium]|nr:deoxyribonuclease IV [Candidatus Omnitrophota bacterium]MCB9784727.1 deoxyribonuclease IV [Candidatus Omnitrophota bacterium]
MSISGGVDKAFARGESVGLEVMQIFTKNNNQWEGKPIDEQTRTRYFEERERTGIDLVFAHASYLINLCATNPVTLKKSKTALLDELERCDQLEIPYLVIHPGSHMGEGEEKGLKSVAKTLDEVFAKLPKGKALLCLENTAGQGSNLGYDFGHLSQIRDLVKESERIGYCFDTCHAFAAGYDLETDSKCRKVFKEFDETAGLEHLKVFHFNDSKKPLGSRRDRHEHIGEGTIGLEAFRFLMKSRKFKNHPMALETPKSDDLHEDLENIQKLKDLLHS